MGYYFETLGQPSTDNVPKFDIDGRLKAKRHHYSFRGSEVARKRYINFRAALFPPRDEDNKKGEYDNAKKKERPLSVFVQSKIRIE